MEKFSWKLNRKSSVIDCTLGDEKVSFPAADEFVRFEMCILIFHKTNTGFIIIITNE